LNAAVLFLIVRLALAAILLAVVVMILVYLRRGLRLLPPPGSGAPAAHLASETQGLESYRLAGVNTIGRSPGNSITLDHPSVSSYHARLFHAAGNWMLEDLGSRNGTQLNGLEVREPLAVIDGDRIQFGGAGFRLLGGEIDASPRLSGSQEPGGPLLSPGAEGERPAKDDSERRQP
jgi:hypothetical protein